MLNTLLAAAALLAGVMTDVNAAPTPGPASAQQIYVIRHLQKAANAGDDPPLSALGSANAAKLAHLLENKGIRAIFATPTRRATETADPLAKRLGIAVTPYDPRSPQQLVQAALSARGNVLIVGHSNTVPALVAAFGGDQPAPLSEDDYGTIFHVSAGSREVGTLRLPAN